MLTSLVRGLCGELVPAAGKSFPSRIESNKALVGLVLQTRMFLNEVGNALNRGDSVHDVVELIATRFGFSFGKPPALQALELKVMMSAAEVNNRGDEVADEAAQVLSALADGMHIQRVAPQGGDNDGEVQFEGGVVRAAGSSRRGGAAVRQVKVVFEPDAVDEDSVYSGFALWESMLQKLRDEHGLP